MPEKILRKKQILLDAPNVGDKEIKHLTKAINIGYVSTYGPFVPEFEKKLSAEIHAPYPLVTTQSGTAALHLALYLAGIGTGDEVIMPSLTFIATANAVSYVGATPVFADVKPETWLMDSSDLKNKINYRTKAIIPVHLYGNPCDMDEIAETIKKTTRKKIVIIEDATESLGAYYKGIHTGLLGDFGCFSFNGNKIITTGGGGAIASKDPRLLKKAKYLVNQARDDIKDGFSHSEVGFNYRMTNLEAAMGLAQLSRLGIFLKKKKTFREIYEDELSDSVSGVKLQQITPRSVSSNWLNCVAFQNGKIRNLISAELSQKGIQNRRVFPPIYYFKPYKKFALRCPISEKIYQTSLCLPSSTLNTNDDIRYTAKTIKKILLTHK